jgi:hypothetical protein
VSGPEHFIHICERFCTGSSGQVVLQPTSTNLPAKKYDFDAAFEADASHEAVFSQVIAVPRIAAKRLQLQRNSTCSARCFH